MNDKTEKQKAIEEFRKQYPEYKDSAVVVEVEREGRLHTIRPLVDMAFSAGYWSVILAEGWGLE